MSLIPKTTGTVTLAPVPVISLDQVIPSTGRFPSTSLYPSSTGLAAATIGSL